MPFRKLLVRIRREYNQNPRRLFLWGALAVLLGTGISIALDLFIPFGSWGNLVRALFLVPYAGALFILGYAVSLYLHYARVSGDPNWVPYRLRMSPTWRRRISAIVGALMFVAIYANGFRIGYTAISSIFVAITLALFAFMRTTKEEAAKEELNIPDIRDTRYQQEIRKREEAREQAQRERAHRRAQRQRTTRHRVLQEDEEDD